MTENIHTMGTFSRLSLYDNLRMQLLTAHYDVKIMNVAFEERKIAVHIPMPK